MQEATPTKTGADLILKMDCNDSASFICDALQVTCGLSILDLRRDSLHIFHVSHVQKIIMNCMQSEHPSIEGEEG